MKPSERNARYVTRFSYYKATALRTIVQIWKEYDEEAEVAAQVETSNDSGPLKQEYLDVIVSDVRTKDGLAFSVQILNTEGSSANGVFSLS